VSHCTQINRRGLTHPACPCLAVQSQAMPDLARPRRARPCPALPCSAAPRSAKVNNFTKQGKELASHGTEINLRNLKGDPPNETDRM